MKGGSNVLQCIQENKSTKQSDQYFFLKSKVGELSTSKLEQMHHFTSLSPNYMCPLWVSLTFHFNILY